MYCPCLNVRALIEFTAFSPSTFQREVYEEINLDYITENLHLNPDEYKITREENGAIPMETRDYELHIDSRIFHFGTISGAAKPSTGFAFMRIQQQIGRLVKSLENDSLEEYPKLINPNVFFVLSIFYYYISSMNLNRMP